MTIKMYLTSKSNQVESEVMHSLLKNANIAVVVVQDFTIQFANRQTEIITGYSEVDLISHGFLEIVHPEDRSMVGQRHHLRTHGENGPDNYEFRIVTKQNLVRWVEIRASLIKWEDKNAVLCFVADITDRKQACDMIKQNEKVLNCIFNASPIGIMLLENRIIRKVNKAICELTGYSEPELLEQSTSLLHPDHESFLQVGENLNCPTDLCIGKSEAILKRKDGSLFYAMARYAPFESSNQSTEVCATVIDITREKQVNQELRDTVMKLHTILEFQPDPTFVIDAEKNVVAWNKAIEDLTGVKKENIIGNGDFAYAIPFYNKKRPILIDLVFSSCEDTKSQYNCVRTFDGKLFAEVFVPGLNNGTGRHLRGVASPIYDQNGVKTGAIETIRDITDRKIAEDLQREMMMIEKMATLGTLVSGIAHEINNPNNYLMLNSTIIGRAWKDILPVIDKHFENSPQFKIADLNYNNARKLLPDIIQGLSDGTQRIKRIVDSLRDYARNEIDCMSQDVDVNKVVESSLVLLANMLRSTTDNFSTHFDPQLPSIKGNCHQLEQVVINLLSNACQALDNRTQRIDVFTLKDGDDVVLKVVDEGRGIPEEYLNRVFDPFFTTKRDIGGTGLGLPISKKIIHNMDGLITIESKEAEGTTVSVRFNADRQPEE